LIDKKVVTLIGEETVTEEDKKELTTEGLDQSGDESDGQEEGEIEQSKTSQSTKTRTPTAEGDQAQETADNASNKVDNAKKRGRKFAESKQEHMELTKDDTATEWKTNPENQTMATRNQKLYQISQGSRKTEVIDTSRKADSEGDSSPDEVPVVKRTMSF
jgi:hypothetical protein